MITSMTGFGSSQREIAALGKITVELRSTNHKFLDIVLHLPEGFLPLEDKVKKAIEAKIKRGRVTGAISICGGASGRVMVNKKLLGEYMAEIEDTKRRFHLQEEVGLDTLLRLPGVLSLVGGSVPTEKIWPALKILLHQALEGLMRMRQKEGRALCGYLKSRAKALKGNLHTVKVNCRQAVKARLAGINTDEERVSLLKDTDITEEIERLSFHIRNFQDKLYRCGPLGKELDFIAQEMQREINTIGAKSCATSVSAKVVQIKSQIEKIREQVQNIE